MSLNQKIIEALKPTGLPVHAVVRQRSLDSPYFVFEYSKVPSNFGDDESDTYIAVCTLRLEARHDYDAVSLIESVPKLLQNAGFTKPEVYPMSDDEAQSWGFRFQSAEFEESG